MSSPAADSYDLLPAAAPSTSSAASTPPLVHTPDSTLIPASSPSTAPTPAAGHAPADAMEETKREKRGRSKESRESYGPRAHGDTRLRVKRRVAALARPDDMLLSLPLSLLRGTSSLSYLEPCREPKDIHYGCLKNMIMQMYFLFRFCIYLYYFVQTNISNCPIHGGSTSQSLSNFSPQLKVRFGIYPIIIHTDTSWSILNLHLLFASK